MKKYNGKSNLIGDLIKIKRKEMGMSASDVCRKLQDKNVFISAAELYRIEERKKMLKDFEMLALCVILDINSIEIMKKYLNTKPK